MTPAKRGTRRCDAGSAKRRQERLNHPRLAAAGRRRGPCDRVTD
jgi:hypothetical protein